MRMATLVITAQPVRMFKCWMPPPLSPPGGGREGGGGRGRGKGGGFWVLGLGLGESFSCEAEKSIEFLGDGMTGIFEYYRRILKKNPEKES